VIKRNMNSNEFIVVGADTFRLLNINNYCTVNVKFLVIINNSPIFFCKNSELLTVIEKKISDYLISCKRFISFD